MATLTHSAGVSTVRTPRVGVPSLFLGASFLLHATVFFLLPHTLDGAPIRVEALDVTLARQELPRVFEAPAPQLRERPKEDRATRVPTEKPASATAPVERAKAPAQESAPRLLLTVPRPAGEPESAFTIPVSPLPTPSADPAPRPEAAKPAPRAETAKSAPPAASALPEAKVTPPNFNAGYLRNPPPRYPLVARRNGEQGTVTLKVLVTREGLPANISVQTTSGSASLDQAAVEAVKGWRFAPARHGAQAVEAWVLVPIVFKLEGVS